MFVLSYVGDPCIRLDFNAKSRFDILLSIPHIGYNKKKSKAKTGEASGMKQAQNGSTLRKERIMIATPIGQIVIAAVDNAVCSIGLARPEDKGNVATNVSHPVLLQAAQELQEYFAGKRTGFTFPMHAEGTAFQQSVWNALLEIPYCETKTYGEIAHAVNNPKGSRAVGMACNKNPIMIAVPCHRVLGAGGALTGYAGGLSIKQALLALEQQDK
jgi:methylated-DNA-[protein]-cysteine S-methyltransferase